MGKLSRFIRWWFLLGAIILVGTAVTGAYYTSSAKIENNTFETGQWTPTATASPESE